MRRPKHAQAFTSARWPLRHHPQAHHHQHHLHAPRASTQTWGTKSTKPTPPPSSERRNIKPQGVGHYAHYVVYMCFRHNVLCVFFLILFGMVLRCVYRVPTHSTEEEEHIYVWALAPSRGCHIYDRMQGRVAFGILLAKNKDNHTAARDWTYRNVM